jgi:hypothetical protein
MTQSSLSSFLNSNAVERRELVLAGLRFVVN